MPLDCHLCFADLKAALAWKHCLHFLDAKIGQEKIQGNTLRMKCINQFAERLRPMELVKIKSLKTSNLNQEGASS
jgi:hypothetical protein